MNTHDLNPQPVTPEGFTIILEEGPCLVLNKPGGVLTQAPPHIDSLESRVKQYLKRRDNKPGKVYLGVPHRLDRPVSGIIVMARHVRAARRISAQFESRTVEKTYWALVEGSVAEAQGTWQDYVRKIPDVAMAEVVSKDHPDARPAILHYSVAERLHGRTWLEIRLETGRMHQIRLQAAVRGFPIVGDSQYGSSQTFGPQTEDLRQRWIALHARSLRFRHPMTQEIVRQTAPLPDYWKEARISA